MFSLEVGCEAGLGGGDIVEGRGPSFLPLLQWAYRCSFKSNKGSEIPRRQVSAYFEAYIDVDSPGNTLQQHRRCLFTSSKGYAGE